MGFPAEVHTLRTIHGMAKAFTRNGCTAVGVSLFGFLAAAAPAHADTPRPKPTWTDITDGDALSLKTAALARKNAAVSKKGDTIAKKSRAAHPRPVRPKAEPSLDSAAVEVTSLADPLVFTVTTRKGVPYLHDPREAPGWHNLRRVSGSRGGRVTQISVAQDSRLNYLPDPTTTTALRVTVQTRDGIFFTVCRLGNLADLNVPLPTAGALPCTPWATLPAV
ncbi:hypothetical protein [Herbidospora sp. NBRC 101105]|uniref:hypothetical protein n=1 Tax=Herbidospora sp. NBRC 101105 TaxID=3032195 RepID=UPI0025545A29|nr:hypothetical protein [Herbidospora sp. NBRC 101105]